MSTATNSSGTDVAKQGGGAALFKPNPRLAALKTLFEGPHVAKMLADALPKHLNSSRFARVFMGNFQRTPKLQECTPESLLLSMLQAASAGLETDGVLGQAYLIPYGKECQLQLGYRGLMRLAMNSNVVADIDAQVVYEKDTFEYELGLEPTLKHKRHDETDDAGALKYVYAVCRFKDGTKKFVVMNRREITQIKTKAQGTDRSDSPWKQWEPEMWKKSAIKRLCKMLPLSTADQRMIQAEDSIETTAVERFVDTDIRDVPADVQAEILQIESSGDLLEPGSEG